MYLGFSPPQNQPERNLYFCRLASLVVIVGGLLYTMRALQLNTWSNLLIVIGGTMLALAGYMLGIMLAFGIRTVLQKVLSEDKVDWPDLPFWRPRSEA